MSCAADRFAKYGNMQKTFDLCGYSLIVHASNQGVLKHFRLWIKFLVLIGIDCQLLPPLFLTVFKGLNSNVIDELPNSIVLASKSPFRMTQRPRWIWLWFWKFCSLFLYETSRNNSISGLADVCFVVAHCYFNERDLQERHISTDEKSSCHHHKKVNSKLYYGEVNACIFLQSCCLFLIFIHPFFLLYVWSQTKKNVIRRHEQTNREKWQKSLMDFFTSFVVVIFYALVLSQLHSKTFSWNLNLAAKNIKINAIDVCNHVLSKKPFVKTN